MQRNIYTLNESKDSLESDYLLLKKLLDVFLENNYL